MGEIWGITFAIQMLSSIAYQYLVVIPLDKWSMPFKFHCVKFFSYLSLKKERMALSADASLGHRSPKSVSLFIHVIYTVSCVRFVAQALAWK